jgi:Domain of unknown function (DUF4268)
MDARNVLGRLEKVELREIWETEGQGFTPWLAREENLEMLGKVIGIELELEAQEKDVGPFRADILCKNTLDDSLVLIENQIERTDHRHLGQLITYAAGLQSVTIVWVAAKFTEEHRAALDWLNEMTDKRIRFFGLEVELWRIGNSPAAPKFNVISKPNNWSKTVSEAAKEIENQTTSETKKLQYRYWLELVDYLEEVKSKLRSQEPRPQHWLTFTIGRSGFHLNALLNTRDNKIGVELVIADKDGTKGFYNLLLQDKELIEREMGCVLEWRENPEKTQSKVALFKSGNIADAKDRAAQQEWIKITLEKFDSVFRQKIRNL